MPYEQKVLKYKHQIVFEKLKMPYFKRQPKLYHQNEACFMFIHKGEFSVRTPDQFISFKQGKGMLAKCFDYFFETSEEQRRSSENLEVLGVILFPSIVEELFQYELTISAAKISNINQIQVDHLLDNFKESINILLDNPEIADEAMIKAKLKEFILLICKSQNALSQFEFLSALFEKNSTEFSKTIHNNLYSSMSLDEYAFLCGMSLSTFKRKFKEVFNESPKRYILKMKLQKATTLLKSNTERISEIAYNCGFESISSFNRAFKSHFGKSPSDFRMN